MNAVAEPIALANASLQAAIDGACARIAHPPGR